MGKANPLVFQVIVFATTLECDGDSVKRMSCVDDSGEMVGANGMNGFDIGTALDGAVCLSVNILSIVVLILKRSCVRIKYKYRYKYKYKYRYKYKYKYRYKYIYPRPE